MYSQRILNKFNESYQVNAETGCWQWTKRAYKQPSHKKICCYGKFFDGKRDQSAHRVSWAIANGPIPAGLYILHSCDNPKCVNPAHLFLGTHQDNMDDMNAKGRHPKTYPKRTVLKSGDADLIRVLRDFGTSIKTLCEMYDIVPYTITKIMKNKCHTRPRFKLTKEYKQAGYDFIPEGLWTL